MLNELKDEVAEFAKLVPELCFDLICRFIPGVCIAFFLYSYYGGNLSHVGWQHIIAGLVFAFFTGSILDYFSDAIMIRFSINRGWTVLAKHAQDDELAKLARLSGIEEDGAKMRNQKNHQLKKSILETLRNAYRIESPDARPVLMKLIAEERLAKNTMVGLPLVMIILAVCDETFLTAVTARWILTVVLLELVLVAASRNRVERTVARAFYWWRLSHGKT